MNVPISKPHPDKALARYTDPLPLMEHFYTIQGEGANAGKPCYFLRLAGCDVGCHWCDVKESWPTEGHPLVSADEMAQMVKQSGATRVVITGGEPLQHDLSVLTRALHTLPVEIYIETSGSAPLTGALDWICLSPKKFKKPLDEVYRLAHELKIIVYHISDLAWGLEQAQKVSTGCRLYFQPEWSREKQLLPEIIEFVKQHPQWSISLQTHKYMNIP